MSAILHRFKIPLTAEQAAAIRAEWLKFAACERTMLVLQPVGMAAPPGQIDYREPHLNCAIFDEELAADIGAEIHAHKRARPAETKAEGK
jgi:hypothetical protein